MLNRHQRNVVPSPDDFILAAYCARIDTAIEADSSSVEQDVSVVAWRSK